MSSGQSGEPSGLSEDIPMPEDPLTQDVGEGSEIVRLMFADLKVSSAMFDTHKKKIKKKEKDLHEYV